MVETNAARETRSDQQNDPTLWCVYIVENGDGGLYIGQTNNLTVRVAEHAMGAGAEATSGKAPRLVWFTHTHSRENALKVEARLKTRYAERPDEIRRTIADFDQLVKMVRPDKTLAQLREEEKAHERDMRMSFHYVPVTVTARRSACGWMGGREGQLFGSSDWDSLRAMADTYDAVLTAAGEEAARKAIDGRPPCRDCLAKQPESSS